MSSFWGNRTNFNFESFDDKVKVLLSFSSSKLPNELIFRENIFLWLLRKIVVASHQPTDQERIISFSSFFFFFVFVCNSLETRKSEGHIIDTVECGASVSHQLPGDLVSPKKLVKRHQAIRCNILI